MSTNKDDREYTDDFEEATKKFGVVLQCGECYTFYDGTDGQGCPVCDSLEVVGDR